MSNLDTRTDPRVPPAQARRASWGNSPRLHPHRAAHVGAGTMKVVKLTTFPSASSPYTCGDDSELVQVQPARAARAGAGTIGPFGTFAAAMSSRPNVRSTPSMDFTVRGASGSFDPDDSMSR